MNIPRRIAALKREIQYRESELVRIAELRAQKEPTVIAFPDFVDRYLVDIKKGIAEREAEILRLQKLSATPKSDS